MPFNNIGRTRRRALGNRIQGHSSPVPLIEDHLNEWLSYLEEQGIDQWAEYNAEIMDHWMETTDKQGTTLRFQTVALRTIPDLAIVFAYILLGNW